MRVRVSAKNRLFADDHCLDSCCLTSAVVGNGKRDDELAGLGIGMVHVDTLTFAAVAEVPVKPHDSAVRVGRAGSVEPDRLARGRRIWRYGELG